MRWRPVVLSTTGRAQAPIRAQPTTGGAVLVLLFVVVAACSGGDGNSTPPPTADRQPIRQHPPVPLAFDQPRKLDFDIDDGLLLVESGTGFNSDTLDFTDPLIAGASDTAMAIDTGAQYQIVDLTVTAHRRPPPPPPGEWTTRERALASPDG
jgi:hypothetical protein